MLKFNHIPVGTRFAIANDKANPQQVNLRKAAGKRARSTCDMCHCDPAMVWNAYNMTGSYPYLVHVCPSTPVTLE